MMCLLSSSVRGAAGKSHRLNGRFCRSLPVQQSSLSCCLRRWQSMANSLSTPCQIGGAGNPDSLWSTMLTMICWWEEVLSKAVQHMWVGGLAGLPYNRLTSQHTISSFAVKKLAAIVVLYSFKLQKNLHGTDSDVRSVVLRRILTLSSSLCDKGSTYPHN